MPSPNRRPADAVAPSSENQLGDTNTAEIAASSLPQTTGAKYSTNTADNTLPSCATAWMIGYGTVDVLLLGACRLNRASVSDSSARAAAAIQPSPSDIA